MSFNINQCIGSDGNVVNNFRYGNKATNSNERRLFQSYWNELNRMYGTFIHYFVYNYELSAHNSFYGEHPLATFELPPVPMTMLAQFNNDSLLLSKFGIRTDADVTFIIPIPTFRAAFNNDRAEPKAGDLIRLTELGWDRPGGWDDPNNFTDTTNVTSCEGRKDYLDPTNDICTIDDLIQGTPIDCETIPNFYSEYDNLSGDIERFNRLVRGAPIFEITERRDENLTMNYNMLGGHYVWILHAKRFDYSYQPNAPREPGHDQVSDETMYGKLSGGTLYPEREKQYDQNVEQEKERIWDYETRPGSDDSVYGNY